MEYMVFVKPGSRKGPLIVDTANPSGTLPALTVHLHEKALDGAANKALIRALAQHFAVAKTDIVIVSGTTSRTKRVRVTNRA